MMSPLCPDFSYTLPPAVKFAILLLLIETIAASLGNKIFPVRE